MTDDFPLTDERGRPYRVETDEEGRTIKIYPPRFAENCGVQVFTARTGKRRRRE